MLCIIIHVLLKITRNLFVLCKDNDFIGKRNTLNNLAPIHMTTISKINNLINKGKQRCIIP